MFAPATLADLLSLLEGGATVLLPNARSAREMRFAFEARQRLHGIAFGEPPAALTWQQWTNSLWSELVVAGCESRLLLNAAQEHSLWREVISATVNDTLTSPDSLAELAAPAYRLAAAYGALARLRSAASTADTRTFAAWADEFSRLCASRNYLSPALLDHALLRHADAAALPIPSALHLVDFTDPTPAQTSLLDALRARGTHLHHHTLVSTAAAAREVHHLLAPTPQEEALAAARITRQLLEANPAARIAMLVPNLRDEAAELDAVLRDILAPELHSIAADLSSTPWEIPSTAPLSSYPLIATAIDAVRLATAPLPIERVSTLLLSPYLGDASGSDAIAIFDTRVLRHLRALRPELDLAGLVALLESPRTRSQLAAMALPAWPRHMLTTLQRADLARPRTFADWTELLRELLRSAGFPGTRPPTAFEAAAARAWDSALDLIATLDFAGRRVPLATALEALTRQLETSTFTPPNTHAAVQVITPDETTGCLFDAILFLRATDANWPPPARANPLLPWTLQRSLNMPGADPAHAAARARELTAGLLARTPTMLFTSASEDADGKLRPSPLLAELHIPTSLTAAQPPPEPAVRVERQPDTAPLPAPPSAQIQGGARVLELQAACGFRAFAEIRLRSAQPESPTLGLDARESGNHLHQALEHFWTEVRSQENLIRFSPAEREAMLQKAIDHTFQQRAHAAWEQAYLEVQKQRLFLVLNQWLEHELERGPFTVLGSERQESIPVGPLSLNIRIDRIDQVADGVVFVDYKTGRGPRPAGWDDARPDDPQLPLYAAFLLQPGELRGLAFAKVRAGDEMQWLGYQAERGILPAARSNPVVDLDARLEDWRQALTVLAYDFFEGRATVYPKAVSTCKHCAQRMLCRLDPTTLLGLADDDNIEELEAADV